ncbi:hypothetical protein ACA910_006091 [Epithemia clementina (nom. ined.)]
MTVIRPVTPSFYERHWPSRPLYSDHIFLQRCYQKPSNTTHTCGISKNGPKTAPLEDQQDIPVQPIHNAQVQNEGNYFTISMDLPGVKCDAIQITETNFVLKIEAIRKTSNGNPVAKFQRKFFLDKRLIANTAEIKAILSDGVLVVEIPKKLPLETIEISPLSSEPPFEKINNSTFFHFQLDIPGVKARDMKITIKDDRLFISAERIRGSPVKRSVAIDDSKVEVAKMAACLNDGVLTLMAPKKNPTQSMPTRTIAVNAESSAEHDTEISKQNNSKTVVETVVEDVEEERKDNEIAVSPSVFLQPIVSKNERKDEEQNLEESKKEDVSAESDAKNTTVKADDDANKKNIESEDELEDYEILN